jgi:hypothetical protein
MLRSLALIYGTTTLIFFNIILMHSSHHQAKTETEKMVKRPEELGVHISNTVVSYLKKVKHNTYFPISSPYLCQQ